MKPCDSEATTLSATFAEHLEGYASVLGVSTIAQVVE